MSISTIVIPSKYTADGTTIALTGKQFGIPDGGIDTTQLADDSVTDAKIDAPVMKVLSDQTIGTAVTSVAFTDLDLETDGMYKIYIYNTNPGGGGYLSMYYNADTTATNYYSQYNDANGGTVGCARNNTANIGDAAASGDMMIEITVMKKVGDITRALAPSNRNAAASVRCQNIAHAWTSTANVTTITLTHSVTSGITSGARIIFMKVGS